MAIVNHQQRAQKISQSKSFKHGGMHKSLKSLKINSPSAYIKLPTQRESEYIDLESFKEKLNKTASIGQMYNQYPNQRYYQ